MNNKHEFKLASDGEFSSFDEMVNFNKDIVSELSDKMQPTFMYGRFKDLDDKAMIKFSEDNK